MPLKQELIEDLMNIEAIQIRPDEPFTWTSGMKSPIYCDNRLIMSNPKIRNKVANGLVSIIENMNEQPDCIAGCATAGIPHAAWIAEKLNLPMIYIRASKKGHGKENQIEGQLKEGQKVVVIEDLISTGGSSIKAAQAVEESGGKVLRVLSIFTYDLIKAEAAFNDADFTFESLTGFETLIEVLKQKSSITAKDEKILLEWQKTLNGKQISV